MYKTEPPHYYEMVYEIVSLIPAGRVTTYGHIADFLALGSARMVGYALRNLRSFDLYDVPAHRVVNSSGVLTGKALFRPPEKMENSLLEEGIEVKKNRVVDFKEKLWIPAEEL